MLPALDQQRGLPRTGIVEFPKITHSGALAVSLVDDDEIGETQSPGKSSAFFKRSCKHQRLVWMLGGMKVEQEVNFV